MSLRSVAKTWLPDPIFRFLRLKYVMGQVNENSREWQSALTKFTQPEVYQKLAQGVGYCVSAGVEGHVAEFGTMWGRTASVLAQSMHFFTKSAFPSVEKGHGIGERKLFLFDSFQGLPETDAAGDKDSPHVKSGLWSEGTCRGITKEDLHNVCSRHIPGDNILIYDGWFEDTLKTLQPDVRFALVHIDSDLYLSAIQVLEYLFKHNHISNGCALFFDDWNCNQASPNLGERKAWQECVDKYEVKFSDGGEYGVTGHKFIIHKE